MILDLLQHASENLVIEAFHKAECYFILGPAVRCDAIPVALNHLGKLLVGLETLPFERIAPVVKEPSGPALRLIVPKLPKSLLEHVGRVVSLVGSKQHPQAAPSFVGEILSVR